MGWYHATNLIEGCCPSARLTDVVEPWFLGAGADSDAGREFAKFVAENPQVNFHSSVAEMPAASGNKLALLAGRTADNPRLLTEVVDRGCTHVFLEKPGAPTVPEMEDMAEYAASKNVEVFMGYNKNVTGYVAKALEFERANPGAVTTFIHNNEYSEAELAECFERNSEGMLKNMAVHELALLVTYYGVRADTLASVVPDKEYSRCLTLNGFTDFAKIGFTATTTSGKTVTVKADRCGGSESIAIVEINGEEAFRSKIPDTDLLAVVEQRKAEKPGLLPYFYLQHDDYVTLKERVCKYILGGSQGSPEGIATLEIGIEALKLAEHLTPELEKALK